MDDVPGFACASGIRDIGFVMLALGVSLLPAQVDLYLTPVERSDPRAMCELVLEAYRLRDHEALDMLGMIPVPRSPDPRHPLYAEVTPANSRERGESPSLLRAERRYFEPPVSELGDRYDAELLVACERVGRDEVAVLSLGRLGGMMWGFVSAPIVSLEAFRCGEPLCPDEWQRPGLVARAFLDAARAGRPADLVTLGGSRFSRDPDHEHPLPEWFERSLAGGDAGVRAVRVRASLGPEGYRLTARAEISRLEDFVVGLRLIESNGRWMIDDALRWPAESFGEDGVPLATAETPVPLRVFTEAGTFTVILPGTSKRPILHEKGARLLYVTEQGLGCAVTQVEPAMGVAKPEALFDQVRDELRDRLVARVVREAPIQLGARRGRSFELERPPSGQYLNQHVACRLYVVGPRLFMAQVTYLSDGSVPAGAPFFLDSFRLLGDVTSEVRVDPLLRRGLDAATVRAPRGRALFLIDERVRGEERRWRRACRAAARRGLPKSEWPPNPIATHRTRCRAIAEANPGSPASASAWLWLLEHSEPVETDSESRDQAISTIIGHLLQHHLQDSVMPDAIRWLRGSAPRDVALLELRRILDAGARGEARAKALEALGYRLAGPDSSPTESERIQASTALETCVREYPGTSAAQEASTLLERLAQ